LVAEYLARDAERREATSHSPGISYVEGWGLMSWEQLIDAGLGTPEMIAWDEAQRAEGIARWAALPWHVRVTRRLRPHLAELRWRLGHAARALRGIECGDR